MRKQVYDLTAADLAAHPVWEHCLDEEGLPNQDEATVRPFEKNGEPLQYDGLLVVRATLTLANGTRFPGYVYYVPETPPMGDVHYGPIADLQPQAITPHGQVMFWYGALVPTREVIAEVYAKLGADAAGVFPVRYVSEVPLATGPISGELKGFYYLVDKRKGWFSKTRVVETVT
jgi:hypothetical protein